MPSENSGKIKITKVKIGNKSIEIVFDNGNETKMIIDADIYCDYYLYQGKEITLTEMQEIKKKNAYQKGLHYAIGLLSTRSYTTLEIRDKLRNKKVDPQDCQKIIRQLKDLKLLDDQKYKDEYIDYALEKGKSQRAIKESLAKRGIELDNSFGNEQQELKNATQVMEKMLAKVEKYPYLMQKHRLYEIMLEAGFPSQMIVDLLEKFVHRDELKEVKILKKDYELAKRKYQSRYQGKELDKRIISFLERKGYYYSEIKNVMEVITSELD